jgi:DNA-binding NtrC family response regulator
MKTTASTSIFIVDDDPFFQNLLKQSLLSELGIQSETFLNGEECIRQLHRMPEIILLDHNLNSEMDGIDVLKTIKSFAPNIQVIFLSAQEEMHVAVNSLKYGAFDYVQKNEEGLKSVNRLVLKIKSYNKRLKRKRAKAQKKRQLAIVATIAVIASAGLLAKLLF